MLQNWKSSSNCMSEITVLWKAKAKAKEILLTSVVKYKTKL